MANPNASLKFSGVLVSRVFIYVAKDCLFPRRSTAGTTLRDAGEALKVISEKYGVERVLWGLKVMPDLKESVVTLIIGGVKSRTITDLVPNMITVMAALPKFYEFLESKLPTLAMRITTKVRLTNLNRAETEDLIRKRIDKCGGEGIKPFTPEAIDEIAFTGPSNSASGSCSAIQGCSG